MEFCCKQIRPTNPDQVVQDIVKKSLECEDYFDMISKFILNVKHKDTYEQNKEILFTISEIEITDELEDLLEKLYTGNVGEISNRRGEYVEKIIFEGLNNDCNTKKVRECRPFINDEPLEIKFNGKKLNKDLDVGFWYEEKWAELYECKVNLLSIIDDNDKWDKLIYLNEVALDLNDKLDRVDVFIGDLQTVTDLKENSPPFPKVLNKKFEQVVKESINGIFNYVNYYQSNKLNIFHKKYLTERLFAE